MQNDQPTQQDSDQVRFPDLKIIGGIGLILVFLALILWPGNPIGLQFREAISPSSTPVLSTSTPYPTATWTPRPEPTQNFPTIEPKEPLAESFPTPYGVLYLSIQRDGYHHLYVYKPFAESGKNSELEALSPTQLTFGNFDDLHPAVSPDGTKIAFSSNRDGPWNIYILDLQNGGTRKFTDSRSYQGNPTWSPDGNFIAYESYQDQNLEIIIQDIEQSTGPINLTNNPAVDHSPSWSNQGRQISFVSTRDNLPRVWIANLDSPASDKAQPVPGSEALKVHHPIWSGDGRFLAWSSSTADGRQAILTWDSMNPEQSPKIQGNGDWPVWDQTGDLIYTLISSSAESFLTAFPSGIQESRIILPAVKMPGNVSGISWSSFLGVGYLDQDEISAAALQQEPMITVPPEKAQLSSLPGVDAPYPELNQRAVESFNSLRTALRDKLGWDFLGQLENAYVPKSEPLEPGYLNQNWLYTGRAVEVSDLPRLAGWMVLIKEEYRGETYWRLYLRTGNQQGFQGRPLKDLPWDFNARYSGSNPAYENGGKIADSIPAGYYLDFTEFALNYGWERLPALPVWQASLKSARYQTYHYPQGQTWLDAMQEIYSPEEVLP
jgi:TolB protein